MKELINEMLGGFSKSNGGVLPDLLKVIFARSEFTFKNGAQRYELKFQRKHIKLEEKKHVKVCQKYEKVHVLQVLRSKVKILGRF